MILDLKTIDVSADKVKILEARLAQVVASRGFDVITGADLRNMLDLEAEKVDAGCTANDTCLAEIASARGTRLVISGQVGELDKETLFLQLALYDGTASRTVARDEVTGNSLGKLANAIPTAVDRLLAAEMKGAQKTADANVPGDGSLPLWTGAATGVLTLVGVGAGVAFGALAVGELKYSAIDPRYAPARESAESFALASNIGWIAAGAVAVLGSASTAALMVME